MTNTQKIHKLSSAIAGVLPFFIFTMAFAGLVSSHYLPLWAWITAAIAEAVLVVTILYTEEEPAKQEPTAQALAQQKYGWGQ